MSAAGALSIVVLNLPSDAHIPCSGKQLHSWRIFSPNALHLSFIPLFLVTSPSGALNNSALSLIPNICRLILYPLLYLSSAKLVMFDYYYLLAVRSGSPA